MRITVVCLGNICRSPVGAAVLRAKLDQAGLGDDVLVDSAGTGDHTQGQPADPRSISVAEQAGYVLQHAARQIQPEWLFGIDLLLAMDRANYLDLQELVAGTGASPRLRMMRSFDPLLSHIAEPDRALNIPNPYYGTLDDFRSMLAKIQASADGLVEQLQAGAIL